MSDDFASEEPTRDLPRAEWSAPEVEWSALARTRAQFRTESTTPANPNV